MNEDFYIKFGVVSVGWAKDFLQVTMEIPRKSFFDVPDDQPIGYATLCVGGQVISEADLKFKYFSDEKPDIKGESPVQVYKARFSNPPEKKGEYDSSITVTIGDITSGAIHITSYL